MRANSTQTGQFANSVPAAALPKIIVIGLGNPILGDDGLGWHVLRMVQARLQRVDAPEPDPASAQTSSIFSDPTCVELDYLCLGGLALMERIIDYTHVIIIDAVNTQAQPSGTIASFPLQNLPRLAMGHLTSAHDTSLQNALQVGAMLGAKLPDKIQIVAIESQAVYDFSESLSEAVAAAIPKAAEMVIQQLMDWLKPVG